MLHGFGLKKTHTIVIGGGPTGLAASYLLKQSKISHYVLEQSETVAASWRALPDHFRLAMPTWEVEFPGCVFAQQFKSEAHPKREQLISFFQQYALHHLLPVCYSTCVKSIVKDESGQFLIATNQGTYQCQNVICCIGPRHMPKFPDGAAQLRHSERLITLHSSEYKNSADFFPNSRVLVVGSGISALTIAQDVRSNGFAVTLACGHDDETIREKNLHLFKQGIVHPFIPSLDTLKEQGINNLGRLIGEKGGRCSFKKGITYLGNHRLNLSIIIFATGYHRSFQILNGLLNLEEGNDSILNPREMEQIKGLYIAGIPGHNQQTVVISEGTEDAKRIVQEITNPQLLEQFALNKVNSKRPFCSKL